ncbi:SAP domain-containing protein [Histoplasma capsulatum G186AR]|uniref:SAP domain-containing protein n=1 Tax=Ajellomyces capsulatus (strain G186AR / H82 / ATCC MYA-2454 / RMSCC 2432) TaxID=447093 RepID=C0NDR0_AJECG|nr:SAP domain-containing protein [Histoplasma capsulatum G186AR]EEH10358.1 SAP domain-containing protein [Histoplasma capsulatum G186AR]
MADYKNWKVTDLKAELKRRGIPQTGLRVKQNFIDRLLQADSAAPPGPSAEPPSPNNPPEKQAREVPEQLRQDEIPGNHQPPVASEPGPEATESKSKELPAAGAQELLSHSSTEDEPMKDKEEIADINRAEAITEDSTAEAQAQIQESKAEEPAQLQDAVKEPAPSVPSAPRNPESATVSPTEETIDSREESIDDSRKRKRRSQSPPPSPTTTVLKRAKAEDGFPRVLSKENIPADTGILSGEGVAAVPIVDAAAPRDAEMQGTNLENTEAGLREPEPTPQSEPTVVQEANEEDNRAAESHSVPLDESRIERPEDLHLSKHPSADARFKSLFPVANGGRELSPSPKGLGGEEAADRIVPPALHPATTSLYIRNFMRPLQPANLKKHLVTLAAPPASSMQPDIIVDFFLDSIKTHSFVTFTNVSAASRVRAALHGTIWPDERTRKPLWVDFIPEEKVKEWIAVEQESGSGARGAPRWEVVYDEIEGGITASLREANRTNQFPSHNNRDLDQNVGREPPLGPRATHGPVHRDSRPVAPPAPPVRYGGEGFKALDDRFLSTAAKPKLYYLPVPQKVAEKRLDRFASLDRARPPSRRGGDEMRKYTFEDTDYFVDRGPEYGSRGRRRGGRGARFRDRGEFRDSWRR